MLINPFFAIPFISPFPRVKGFSIVPKIATSFSKIFTLWHGLRFLFYTQYLA